MKNAILIAGFVLFGGIAMAQTKPNLTPEHIAEKQTEKMVNLLSLTAEQQVQVQAINLEYAGRFVEEQAKDTPSESVITALYSEQTARIAEVLTESQRQEFAVINARYEDRMRERNRERGTK